MTKLNQKIFKAYDIRGIYPEELNEDTTYLIGQAFAKMSGAKKVVVGRDMRLGSPELAAKLIQGLLSQGVDVDDIGMMPIDAVYFAIGKYKYDGGIMVTASHNPKEYNGFKMATLDKKGLYIIRGVEIYDYLAGKTFPPADTKGRLKKKNLTKKYIDHVLSFVEVSKIRPFKIVIDAGNGMAGKIAPLLFKQLPCQLIPLNFDLDGNFPGHPSNPLLPESQIQIKETVVNEKADLGVIMDGDTDRMFFITEKGDFIRADTSLIILAKYFLEKYPGAGIAYNAICSKAVPQRIKEWGGQPIRSKVGFANVAQAMKDHSGVMSGEVSAHYAFKDNYYADSGFIGFLILLMLISKEDKPLSQIVEGLNPYFRADEINIEVHDIPGIIDKIKKKYSDAKQDELDGVTIEYTDWWVNVRPSNTEPLLRITIEGNTREIMEQKQEEVVNYIKSIA